MINTVKESFGLTNKYIILATPLILFSLISTIYLVLSTGGNYLGLIIALFLFFMMLCAFLAGWFHMVSLCVRDADSDNPNGLIKNFFAGVGEYFLSVAGMVFILFFFGTVLFILSSVIGYKIIGFPDVSVSELSAAVVSVESMKGFLASLNTEQLIKINLWNLLLFLTITFGYYIAMFYPAALFFKTKNPFKAFWYSIKDLFTRHFFKNAGIFILVFMIYSIISILSAIGGANMILHFILTLVKFYFTVYAAVLIFSHYYKNYVQVGSKIDETV